MGNAIEITDANFEEVVLNSDKAVMVDFWAAWCGPCRIIAPFVEQLADEMSESAVVGKLDVDVNRETAIKYGVMNIPTVLFFKNGEVVDRQVGAAAKSVYTGKLQEAATV